MDPQDFEQVQEVGDNGVEDEENLDQNYPTGGETEELTADELVDQPAGDNMEDDGLEPEESDDQDLLDQDEELDDEDEEDPENI